uniref:RNA polymerase sigma factor n=1 Tax=Hypseocharis bilobata TaxID=253189 RepID=A0A0G2STP4_9ROSI|nr:sigma factor [Hypseocharis bilobata]
MSCLLPQFKCQPDTFSIQFRTPLTKIRGPIYFRAQCILSTMSAPTSTATTTLLHMEKLQIPSLEAHSNSISEKSPWTHIGALGPPTEAKFEATLATEKLLTSDEAIITAAAAEAVALAKAAVKVAKDARAEMATILPEVNAIWSDWVQLIETEEGSEVGVSVGAETGPMEDFSVQYPTIESSYLEAGSEELKFLQEQLSNSVAVRSTRQKERKARRAKAAEKAAANVVSVKSGSTSRKKRGSSQDIDHSDPLRYLRATTSSYKLLTVREERELSEGIQDLLKLEMVQKEVAERLGGEPTLAQWAAAARVDRKTLTRRLNYGMFCKDKMLKSNIRLVISIAKKYQGAGMEIQDLVQEGCRGLLRGAEKFDASKGFKFSTYAHWWVKQAIRKCLSENSRLIRIPFHMVEASYKVREARKRFVSDHRRQPNKEELAKAAGVTMKRLNDVLMLPKAPRSLDQKIGTDGYLKPAEVIEDPNIESAEEVLMKQFMKRDLERVLDTTLNRREKEVIRWRFGLDDGRMKALQEIGELLSVSRERIRQIESCALRKLKRTTILQQYVVK